MRSKARVPAPLVIAIAYLAGSIPFSGLVARVLRGVDLRTYGTGTVSGTGLYRVGGLGPLLVGGVLDVTKGAVGPALAGRDRPRLAAVAGGATVIGHNWSIFLRGAGGRGISTALGSMVVTGWEGAVYLLAMVSAGKAVRSTSLGAFVGYVTLPSVLARYRADSGLLTGLSLVTPMLVKRVMGNRPLPGPGRARLALTRLLFDQDTPQWPLRR